MFIGMTTAAAMIAGMEQVPTLFAGYAASKAALNSIVRRLHFDFPELISFVVHPGLVCRSELEGRGEEKRGEVQAVLMCRVIGCD